MARDRGDDEIHAERARRGRLVGDQVQLHRARRRDVVARQVEDAWNRIRAGIPDLRKRTLKRGDRGPAQLDTGIAPWLESTFRVAEPSLAQAETAHKADLAVDDDRLAMIAREPSKGLASLGGLNTRTTPPASRSVDQSDSQRKLPIQSTTTRTATPARARSTRMSRNSRPTLS